MCRLVWFLKWAQVAITDTIKTEHICFRMFLPVLGVTLKKEIVRILIILRDSYVNFVPYFPMYKLTHI